MKSCKLIYLIGLFSVILNSTINTIDNVITLFINHESVVEEKVIDHESMENISNKLQQPEFIFSGSNNKSVISPYGCNGIDAIYLGYLTTSNKNGQISFPRKQQSDEIHLLITPKMIPIFMVAPTLLYGWNIDKSVPMAMYRINRKKHKNLDTYYFDVRNIQDIIHDDQTDTKTKTKYQSIIDGSNAIPLNTITLISNPDNINVPQGISLNHYSPNFTLPTLTAKKTDTTEHSLYTLTIKQYFEQINIESKRETSEIAAIIANQ